MDGPAQLYVYLGGRWDGHNIAFQCIFGREEGGIVNWESMLFRGFMGFFLMVLLYVSRVGTFLEFG